MDSYRVFLDIGFLLGVHNFGSNLSSPTWKTSYMLGFNAILVLLTIQYLGSMFMYTVLFGPGYHFSLTLFQQWTTPALFSFFISLLSFDPRKDKVFLKESLKLLESTAHLSKHCAANSSPCKISSTNSTIFVTALLLMVGFVVRYLYNMSISFNLILVIHTFRIQIIIYQLSFFIRKINTCLSCSTSTFVKDPTATIKLNSRLVQLVRFINQWYSKEIVLISFEIFILTTSHLYFFVNHLFREYSHSWPAGWEAFADMFILATHTYFFLPFLVICQRMSGKAENFNRKLYHKVLNEDDGKKYLDDPRIRLHLAHCENFQVTACKFFKVDLTLMQMILSGAVTYLVILVQMEQYRSERTKANSQVN